MTDAYDPAEDPEVVGYELRNRSWDDFGIDKQPFEVRYPWHRWLNGRLWFLVQGVHYETSTKKFQEYAHEYVTTHGIRIRTKQNEARTGLFVQAFKLTSGDGERRRRHFRKVERAWLARVYGEDPKDYVPSPHLMDDNWDPDWQRGRGER